MHITSESVAAVFESVPSVYDRMNNLMSFGLHHTWKDMLVNALPLSSKKNFKLIDMATGTGDVAKRLMDRAVRDRLRLDLFACDASQDMLAQGQLKYKKALWSWRHEDARSLSFKTKSIDGYLISFGLRNIIPFYAGLKEAHRVLKPGGFFFCLEFSHPTSVWMEVLYQAHSQLMIPLIARAVAKNVADYTYLTESIARFPKADLLESFLQKCGFEKTGFQLIHGGIVALHWGYKPS